VRDGRSRGASIEAVDRGEDQAAGAVVAVGHRADDLAQVEVEPLGNPLAQVSTVSETKP
jgi:hypothetical protein